MLEKFLKEVVVLVVGKQAEGVADLLNSKVYVNEFIIAKKLDVTINQARNILYKMSNFGLVSSTRKKDKKKGWYTYYWKIEVMKSLEFLKAHLQKYVEQIKNQIKSRETKQFYICGRCNVEFNEENALLHDFTCQECGEIFTLQNNVKILKDLNRDLTKLNDEIQLIDVELEKEKGKVGKEKEKETKKLDKAKKKAKDILNLERKKARAKLNEGKKPVKKSSKKVKKKEKKSSKKKKK